MSDVNISGGPLSLKFMERCLPITLMAKRVGILKEEKSFVQGKFRRLRKELFTWGISKGAGMQFCEHSGAFLVIMGPTMDANYMFLIP